MGQRLVVTVRSKDEDICKIYYHWSAYSVSALVEAKSIIDAIFDEENDIADLRLRLIRFCEQNGGGIDGGKDSDEWNYITREYPDEVFKSEGISRNDGLIALSEKGMDDIQYWSEGDIIIDLDKCKIINGVHFSYANIEDYNDNAKLYYDEEEYEDKTLDDIPALECDLYEFDFAYIIYLIEALRNATDYVVRYGSNIYELIA